MLVLFSGTKFAIPGSGRFGSVVFLLILPTFQTIYAIVVDSFVLIHEVRDYLERERERIYERFA